MRLKNIEIRGIKIRVDYSESPVSNSVYVTGRPQRDVTGGMVLSWDGNPLRKKRVRISDHYMPRDFENRHCGIVRKNAGDIKSLIPMAIEEIVEYYEDEIECS